jgi:hypothetical protein
VILTSPIRVRCHYCSKFRSPHEIVNIGTGGAMMCWHCLEWHKEALMVLAGHPPPGCQECGVTFAELKGIDPGGNVRMYVHPKDGLYQVLCKPCSDAYLPKRVDLYGDTQYGWDKKLKGAK